MRKLVGGTVIALVVVLALGLAGGGWYYTDELLPAPVPGPEPDYALTITAVDDDAGTVTVAATEGDVRDLATVGLWTADHTLELGETVAEDATSVTRTATPLDDAGWPSAGDAAATSATTYRGDPTAALDATFELVTVDGPTGPLPAWDVVPDEAAIPGTYAILVHGRGATRADMHRELRSTLAAGVPALVISVRGDPDAVADPDGFGRYGDAEWADLQAAVDLLVEERDVERLVPIGASQGGAIVLTWLRRGEHTERTAGAVLVSPLVRLHGTLELQAADRGIPGPVIGPLLWSTERLASLRAGLDVGALDQTAPDAVAAFADVPMLLTHGTDDGTVPFADSARLAELLPDTVRFEVYEGAGHVREWNADPERFDADLLAFLRDTAG